MDEFLNGQRRDWKQITVLMTGLFVLCLQGCSNNPPAPVEERRVSDRTRHQVLPAPDVYVVKRGDTLYAIAFRFGLDFRDVANWNQLRSTDLIRTGQRLKLKSPPVPAKSSLAKNTQTQKPPQSRPYEPPPKSSTPGPAKSKPAASRTPSPPPSTGKVAWQWPAGGRIIQAFSASDASRPGLDIGGTEGQAVKAAAAGSVVYSGSGLIGYGELIIIKHNDRLLSAYAHNRKRMVQENDPVKAGQKIAEMGRNGSNRVMLHFEIREHGTPVDPLRYLPKR